MNGILLMIPLFVIRFTLLSLVNQAAVKRAAFFPPTEGNEKIAHIFYQLSNIFLILYPVLLKVEWQLPLVIIAGFIYLIGILLLVMSTLAFAKPAASGINTQGIYKISRNPMYLAYFSYFLGCVLLTKSVVLLVALVIFQLTTHWLILSEERWCIAEFGEEYLKCSPLSIRSVFG
ncbi:protein-S-isoprenylcysteine O-methyltransferase Ste14 [Enterococcus sp. PF1-24]|uniref:methyltransferase family protein n=1 Tax=unclassified Enterococcus TaxID=2608891 RepID=UPI00247546F1|nr:MULTISPECIES: isoprenylcysteine carboxylmethyltransferase family protein [unclassified Enterococcus]MDH6363756.1 protein-S-isoprenylcysteine O-methyltransferase Ste14 [Enterococcus sp. PFB1-1]MDH6400712.1 protein-S-isoprenylcysteine O-methyltransferase Ste14 [Enterococcus sp. PF1-24]